MRVHVCGIVCKYALFHQFTHSIYTIRQGMVSCLQLPQISDTVKRYTYFRRQTLLCQRPIQYPSLEEERKSRRTQFPNKGGMGGEEMKCFVTHQKMKTKAIPTERAGPPNLELYVSTETTSRPNIQNANKKQVFKTLAGRCM